MKLKKIAMRMCLGCQEMKAKKELIRVVKNKDNEICIDFAGKKPGRGAYICKKNECLAKAQKAKRLERAFESKIDDEIYSQLIKQLEDNND